jgi:hypothetical protein
MAKRWSGLASSPSKTARVPKLIVTVIVLIAAEIIVAAINIVVDLYAGVD